MGCAGDEHDPACLSGLLPTCSQVYLVPETVPPSEGIDSKKVPSAFGLVPSTVGAVRAFVDSDSVRMGWSSMWSPVGEIEAFGKLLPMPMPAHCQGMIGPFKNPTGPLCSQ